MAIRALHQFVSGEDSDPTLIAQIQKVRAQPGCLEAEAYRNNEQRDHVAVVELWEDQYAYGEHWARVLAEPAEDSVWRSEQDLFLGLAPTEFYTLAPYYRDRIWVPAAHRDRTAKIVWPARGMVRIISPGGVGNAGDLRAWQIENAMETRREPGCIQFDHHTSIEVPQHTLLLELWEDEFIYDAHWNLRIKSQATAAAPARVPFERTMGRTGIEFYRAQPFIHLYDRWLPADVTEWSETVIWPD